jgi:F420-non-reducing hydrogenase small subunit
MPMKPRLSFEWLHACSGCEISLLNYGEELLPLFDQVEIVHFPLLMDHKYTRGSSGSAMSLPKADIGLVSGGVAHAEHLEVLQEMRTQCRTLIALGTCATHGGIPAMRNQWSTADSLETVYTTATTDSSPAVTVLTGFFDRVYSIDEKVGVKVSLPGCPPRPQTIVAVIEALLNQKTLQLPHRSVCETCPTVREEGRRMAPVQRFLDNADYSSDEPVSSMRCLLEQGLLCMGPVTAGGCGGKEAPLCIRARVPCRGCYGPVRAGGNQLLDMMNGLASNGIDHRTIVDRKSLLRFSGAHGRIKPLKKRNE